MGLFRHHDEVAGGRRFVMREKLLSIGDDYWIDDDRGEHAFKVNGKAVRIRDTWALEDPAGREVAHIQERKVRVRGTMKIERDGETMATVHKALVGVRDRFSIDIAEGEDLSAKGNMLDHEYEIKRDGTTVAAVTKAWARVRDTYGIEVAQGEDEPLLLAVAVAIEELAD